MQPSPDFDRGPHNTSDIARVEADSTTGHHALISHHAFEAGACIISFAASSIQQQADRFSIQRNETEHIILAPGYLKYLNHSCEPNCFADVDLLQLTALKHIQPGDELTFFYPSTEWNMSEPFACHCNTAGCLKKIQGAAHIAPDVLVRYRLSYFIQHKNNNRY